MNIAADYRTEFSAAANAFKAEASRIKGYIDPNLSTQGLHEKRREMAASNRARLGATVAGLRAKASNLRESLQSAADRVTPAPPASTHDSWIRAQMLLDAGRHLHQVIQYADANMLHAITEFGPTYLEAQQPAPTFGEAVSTSYKPVDLSGLHRSIAKRWAELDPKTTEAFTEKLENIPDLAALDVELRHAEAVALDTLRESPFDLSASIAADMAKNEAAASLEAGF